MRTTFLLSVVAGCRRVEFQKPSSGNNAKICQRVSACDIVRQRLSSVRFVVVKMFQKPVLKFARAGELHTS